VDTPWTTWTWSEYRNNADSFAKALISIGFEKHDVINILGFNAPEWFFSSFGAILAGGIGMYLIYFDYYIFCGIHWY